MDYYDILGLSDEERKLNGDSFEKIVKKKYKELALKYHPDRQVGKSEDEKKASEDKFKEINEAYSVLSDPSKRSEYDLRGQVGGVGFDMNDMWGFMSQHMASHFSGFGREASVQRGSDVKIKIDCTVENIYHGVTKKIKYGRLVHCQECHGTGSADGKETACHHCGGSGVETIIEQNDWMQSMTQTTCRHCGGRGKIVDNPCKKCGGNGLERVSETIDIEIPKEIRDGYQIRIRGKGNMASGKESIPGDLIVVFHVVAGMFAFMDNAADICCKTEVGILDCITGCEKEISCIDGTKTKVKIPAGTTDMTPIIVPGKGMHSNGNMVVFVKHRMPSKIGDDERKKIDELKKMKNFKKL